jgi:hypothetical protein
LPRAITLEEIAFAPAAQVGQQRFLSFASEQDNPFLVAFPPHANDALREINILASHFRDLRETATGRIERFENCAVSSRRGGFDDPGNFIDRWELRKMSVPPASLYQPGRVGVDEVAETQETKKPSQGVKL